MLLSISQAEFEFPANVQFQKASCSNEQPFAQRRGRYLPMTAASAAFFSLSAGDRGIDSKSAFGEGMSRATASTEFAGPRRQPGRRRGSGCDRRSRKHRGLCLIKIMARLNLPERNETPRFPPGWLGSTPRSVFSARRLLDCRRCLGDQGSLPLAPLSWSDRKADAVASSESH